MPQKNSHWAAFPWNWRQFSNTHMLRTIHGNLGLTTALSFAYQLSTLVPLPWMLSLADHEEICCSPQWHHRYLRTGHPDLPGAARRNKNHRSLWELSRGTICRLWTSVQNIHTFRVLLLLGILSQWECSQGFEKLYKLGVLITLQEVRKRSRAQHGMKAELGFYPRSAGSHHVSSLSFPICQIRAKAGFPSSSDILGTHHHYLDIYSELQLLWTGNSIVGHLYMCMGVCRRLCVCVCVSWMHNQVGRANCRKISRVCSYSCWSK